MQAFVGRKITSGKDISAPITHQFKPRDKLGRMRRCLTNCAEPYVFVSRIRTKAFPERQTLETALATPAERYARRDWAAMKIAAVLPLDQGGAIVKSTAAARITSMHICSPPSPPIRRLQST